MFDLIKRVLDALFPDDTTHRCERCGGKFVYICAAPICLKCDEPGDYLRYNRRLRI